jgi:hypothetical protein
METRRGMSILFPDRLASAAGADAGEASAGNHVGEQPRHSSVSSVREKLGYRDPVPAV